MLENTEKYKLKSLVISFPKDNNQCNFVQFLIISNIYIVLSVCQALFLSILHLYYGLNCVFPHSCVENLTPNVIVFGDRVFKEAIKVK